MATVAVMTTTMGTKKNTYCSNFLRIILVVGMTAISTEANGGTPTDGGKSSGLLDGDGIGLNPAPDERVFNILSYGAKPDGKKDNVEAFMNAYRAACDHPGKARLLVPQGTFSVSQVMFSGPCAGPGPMVVQISGTIVAVSDVSMYPSPEWLTFVDINGLVILGGGTVNGQGEKIWKYNDCADNSNCARLSSSIVLQNVTNGSIRRITSLNPMGFHFFITDSKKIRLQRLNIKAPADSPNTDGVHISDSDEVSLSRSVIGTGDDCVGILQGSTRIQINKIHCGPGHGISIGSLGKHVDEDDVRGVQVKNCTIRDTTNGIRIKTFPYKPEIVPIKASGLLFEDILMENVRNPIIIDQEYCGRGHSCVTAPSKIELSDIHFYNIRGSTITPEAISIKCSSAVPCNNVHLRDINLKGVNGPTTGLCVNAHINTAGVQIPPVQC